MIYIFDLNGKFCSAKTEKKEDILKN